MPLYEYYCRACNQKFTQLRPRSAATEVATRCEAGHKAMKVLTAPAFSVAGSHSYAEAAEAASARTGGGCACGRGACACGGPSLN